MYRRKARFLAGGALNVRRAREHTIRLRRRPCQLQIGERFFIDRGTGVAIGETAIIGQRVRLYQGVTLGASRFPRGEDGTLLKGQARHPIIEDEVVIYAGATVLGRITIGRGSTIGGNVWVTQSVAAGSHITQAKVKVRHEDLFEGGAGI